MVLQHFKRPLGLIKSSNEQKPWLLRYRSSKWFILLTVTAAVFTDLFLYAVIVPVIPFALQNRAGVAENQVQSWVSILIAIYGGTLALASPLCGWLADASPNRRISLIAGLLALGSSTILLNLGRSIAVLIVGRVLQGMSAAVVWTVGLALVADTVDVNEVGEMMGYVFSAMSIATIAGPLLGGVVFNKAGYNAVFGMAYGLIGIDIAMRLFLIEKKDAKKWELPKPIQEMTISSSEKVQHDANEITAASPTSVVDLEKSIEDNLPKDNQPTQDTAAETEPPSADTTSIRPEKRIPAMIILLKSRRLLCAEWACFAAGTLMTQFDSVLPLFVKDTFGWNSIGAGLIFLPVLLPSFLSPLVGWGIDHYGPRWFSVAGFLLFGPIEVLLRLVTHNSMGQKVLLCALLTLIGVALDLAATPLLVEITLVVEQKERDTPGLFGKKGAYAQAYGLFNLAWATGCLVGPIWAGLVREHEGWGTMTWSLSILSFVTIVPVAIWTGGSIFDKHKSRGRRRDAEVPVPAADSA